jgi:hypothetical protein
LFSIWPVGTTKARHYRLLADNALFYVGIASPKSRWSWGWADSGFRRHGSSPARGFDGVIGDVSGKSIRPERSISGPSFPPRYFRMECLAQTNRRISCFVLSGDEEIQGIDPARLGWFTFEVPSSSPIGALLVLDFQDAEVRSLDGCPFLLNIVSGQVSIGEPPSSVENWVLFDPDR